MTATETAGSPDRHKRRAPWLEANACGAITCEDQQFIARLGAREIWRHRDLGKLMDQLDYLGGPYGKAVGRGARAGGPDTGLNCAGGLDRKTHACSRRCS